MSKLAHSKVYRGGSTAKHIHFETDWCTFEPNASDHALDFRFRLASKGGGKTQILLQVGLDDLPMILEATSSALPESANEILGTHIRLDKEGRAWIDNTQIKVTEIAAAHFAYGWDARLLHEEYPHLTLAQIYAALAYTYDNESSLRREMIDQERRVALWRQKGVESPLQKRLQELKRTL